MENKNRSTDYKSALDNRRKRNIRGAFFSGALEVCAEVSFYVIAVIIGLCIFAIFGVDDPDIDNAEFIGGAVLMFLIGAPIGIYIIISKKRRTGIGNTIEDTESDEPKNLRGADELYSALSEVITPVTKSGDTVYVEYRGDTLAIREVKKKRFSLSFNGEEYDKHQSSDEAYKIAVEFAHEKRRECRVFRIYDTQISEINRDELTYLDSFLREHRISFSECCKSFCEESGSGINTLGIKNQPDLSYILYTGEVRTAVVFRYGTKPACKENLLQGNPAARFSEFENEINKHGYSLCDILSIEQ